MTPYYADESVTLYHGDCRELVPALNLTADLIVADPPYGETSLAWDRWPDGWPGVMVQVARSMWCFGSMRMFLDRRDEFAAWRLSQDVIWRKPQSSTIAADRFRRNHEHALHWYQGEWSQVHHDAPRQATGVTTHRTVQRYATAERHTGARGPAAWEDDGTRVAFSVIDADSFYRNPAILHPTQKPASVLDPLIRYGCPEGGLVLDPFAGSGSTAEAARLTGRKAILIEADERYCATIARRMSQAVLT